MQMVNRGDLQCPGLGGYWDRKGEGLEGRREEEAMGKRKGP